MNPATDLHRLLDHDVARSIFQLVREHAQQNGGPRGTRPRNAVRQAAEATEVGLLGLVDGRLTEAELAERFGCSLSTISRRRRLLRDALSAALAAENGNEGRQR